MTCLCASISLSSAAESAGLDVLIAAAKTAHPAVVAAREKWRAAQCRTAQSRSWDQPKLTLEYWGVPEGSLNISDAPEKMYGINQVLPFPGKIRARSSGAAQAEVAAQWEYAATVADVAAQIKNAYAEYYYAVRSVHIYAAAADIMNNISAVAESRYATGTVAQSDLLRTQIETEKMHAMLLTARQEKGAIAVQLQILSGSAEPVIEEPPLLDTAAPLLSWEQVQQHLASGNPALGKASADMAGAQFSRRSAVLAYYPDLDITVKRKTLNGEWAGSDIMVGVILPLWYGKQSALYAESGHALTAAAAEKSAIERQVTAAAKQVLTQLSSTRQLAELYAGSIVPKSRTVLNITQTAFIAGRANVADLLEAVRSYTDFSLAQEQYRVQYLKYLAELERSMGAGI